MSLKEKYESVSHCQKDADCAYLGDDFAPWTPASGPRVVIDDCSWVPVLPVGNVFECVASQLELLMKRDLVRQVCAAALPRVCGTVSGLEPGSGQPVCDRGFCRANLH